MGGTPRTDETLCVVTVGHVDHGKSTVIGRLMADTGVLPDGKLEQIRENCRRTAKPFEYAFLLDALKDEQTQGITIDTARCFFSTEQRRYIVMDAPGHIEFLKNMVTGASRAEAALLVIDAARGVEENTRRHGYFLSILGIRQVAVLVNKMDLVGYDQCVYDEICEDLAVFLEKINITPDVFIPISGVEGDNIASVSEMMPWYTGPTVVAQLDGFTAIPKPDHQALRLPVQGVYRFTERDDRRRIIAGTVVSGTLHAGDKVVFLPSGKRTTVKSLEYFNGPAPEAFTADEAASIQLSEEMFIRRGEVVAREDEELPDVGVRLRVNLFWLGRGSFVIGKEYLLKCGTAKVGMRLESVNRVINASDLSCYMRQYVERNEVAECTLSLDAPIAFDIAGTIEATSRFVIVDDYEIAGGGIIVEALEEESFDGRNIRWQGSAISSDQRLGCTTTRGLVIWMTGLSGAGKTTIASEVESRLVQRGIATRILDGDHLRHGLNGDLGFSAEDRQENIRRAAEVAKLFRETGIVTIVTLISPFEESREAARACIGDDFLEVYVKASFETCAARDPKNLYRKAASGGIDDFTGMGSPYEVPERPDLILDTEDWSEEECVEMLLAAVLSEMEGCRHTERKG